MVTHLLAALACGALLSGCPGDDDGDRDSGLGPAFPDGSGDWICDAGPEQRVCRHDGAVPTAAGPEWTCEAEGGGARCERLVSTAIEPWLDVGTGGVGTFEPLSDGQTAYLARGCQGSQHVWISLRAANIDLQPAIINLLFERDSDGETVSIPLQVRLRFEVVDGEDYEELTGLALVVPDADALLGLPITLRARVAENLPGGVAVTAERRLTVQWGDEICGTRGDGGPPADGGPDAGPILPGPDGGDAADSGAVDAGMGDAGL